MGELSSFPPAAPLLTSLSTGARLVAADAVAGASRAAVQVRDWSVVENLALEKYD